MARTWPIESLLLAQHVILQGWLTYLLNLWRKEILREGSLLIGSATAWKEVDRIIELHLCLGR